MSYVKAMKTLKYILWFLLCEQPEKKALKASCVCSCCFLVRKPVICCCLIGASVKWGEFLTSCFHSYPNRGNWVWDLNWFEPYIFFSSFFLRLLAWKIYVNVEVGFSLKLYYNTCMSFLFAWSLFMSTIYHLPLA